MNAPDRAPDAKTELESLLSACELYLRAPSDGSDVTPAQLSELLKISGAVNRIHDRRELLNYVTDRLRELFDADNSFVVLFARSGEPEILSAHVRDKAAEQRIRSPLSMTLIERVRRSRRAEIINNCSDEPELREQSSVLDLRLSSVLIAPLIVNEEVIGVIQFDHRGDPHPFPQSDFSLLSLFADQVATAFFNLRLMEDMQTAQSYLVQAERLSALGEMSAGIAHDFNNSLFVALGLCDVLLTRDSLDPSVRTELEKIRTCALDAAETVQRLQVFARGGRGPGKGVAVDLRPIVEGIPEFTRHKWSDEAVRRGVTIEVSVECEDTPPVWGPAAAIREILTNLIFNSVDAIEEKGAIRLRTGVERGRVYVAVIDDGIGMDEETRRHVFEPFFTTKGSRGVGFGLSTSWRIAQRLGGELQIAHSSPGTGTELRLWLQAADKVSTDEASEQPQPSRQCRILVVDDDPEVLDLMPRLIESMGHTAVGCDGAIGALQEFDRGDFDVVITDLGMPDLTGADLIRELRRRSPTVPILLLTGWGAEVDLDDEVREMVNKVIAKPVPRDELAAVLAQVL